MYIDGCFDTHTQTHSHTHTHTHCEYLGGGTKKILEFEQKETCLMLGTWKMLSLKILVVLNKATT